MAIALDTPIPALSTGTPAWIGGYRVLDCIAEGGMGRIFRALDTRACRMVAMKTPRTGAPSEVLGLVREAATLRRIRHPGIVRLEADGTWDGMPWLAMELLEGRTLSEEIAGLWGEDAGAPGTSGARRRGSDELPTVPGRSIVPGASVVRVVRGGRPPAGAGRLGEVAGIVGQLATILEHVHGRGLVHRDVKPANVFLRRAGEPLDAGGAPRVTLLDFGLVCRADGARPETAGKGLCVGTMQYAAPEQIVGDPVDGRTDVYSLGCILYELVTGVRPFDAASGREVAERHLYREPAAPSQLVSDLPWQMEDLVVEMLAKKPADRPASAAAVGERIKCVRLRPAPPPSLRT